MSKSTGVYILQYILRFYLKNVSKKQKIRSEMASLTPKLCRNMYHNSIYVKKVSRLWAALFFNMADGGQFEFWDTACAFG